MPSWCLVSLTISGPEKDRAAFLARAGKTLDFNVWKPFPEDEYRQLDALAAEWDRANVDDSTGKLIDGAQWTDRPQDRIYSGGDKWRFTHWGTDRNACSLDEQDNTTHFIIETDCIKCSFATAHDIPFPILFLMSEECPELTFSAGYWSDVKEDSGRWSFQNGECWLQEHEVHWFYIAKEHEPTHHFVAEFDRENANVRELIEQGVLFKPETVYFDNEYAFQCDPDSLGVPALNTRRYTLNEDAYLTVCCVWAAQYGLGMEQGSQGGPEIRDCPIPLIHTAEDIGGAAICNCPITLTMEEMGWLREQLAASASTDSCYKKSERRVLHELFTYTGGCQTNRRTLAHLLECPALTDTRRGEIREAMKRPKWQNEWREWDRLKPEPKRDLSTPESSFMAELRGLNETIPTPETDHHGQ